MKKTDLSFKQKLLQLNCVKTTLICISIIGFGIIFGYVAFPKILKTIMKLQLKLTPGTQMRDMFTEVPFPLDFKIYLFNVTNKAEVNTGGKPKLQEVGPFYFEEWKVKYDLVDDDEADTLEYSYKNIFIYNPVKNGEGLTGEEIITLVNPMILGIALGINVERRELLPFIDNAIKGLFQNPTDAFWTGRVLDILFDGIPLDCSSDAFEVAAACSEFSTGDHKNIQPLNETFYKFSLFGGANATDLGRFTVLRGSKNIRDLGRVLKFNDETEMDTWYGDECNQYRGTDSTIFPPFYKRGETVWAFEPQLCRSMGVVYEHPSKYQGIKTSFYSLDFGDIENDPELHCLCREPERCPVKGTFDLFPCLGAPLVATLPHFLKTHPSVTEKIASGMNPNEYEHGIRLDFYEFSGTPLSGAKRMQLNWEVVPLEEVKIMKDFQEMLLPMMWIEEGVQLNKTFVNMLKYQLILALQVQDTVKYGSIFGGIVGLIATAVAFYMQNEAANQVEVVSASSTKKKGFENQNTNSIGLAGDDSNGNVF